MSVVRFVTKHLQGWAVQAALTRPVISLHDTQQEAVAAAKKIVADLGGGEVRIQGTDGKWINANTVPLGNDPHPPIDKKH